MAQRAETTRHTWRFFRAGGFDQVSLETGDDLVHLRELDPKLWTVLSCPVTGLEVDRRTLELLDTDGDGHIRIPEVLAAVEWATSLLKDPGALLDGGDLPLDAIDDSKPEGAVIRAAAARALTILGKAGHHTLTTADFDDPTRLFAPDQYNGDGIVPPHLAPDDELRRVIVEILMTVGGETDRSGEQGISAAHVDAFFEQVAAYLAWLDRSAADADAILPLGEDTAAAFAAFEAVEAKIDDYFARCRLAEFDPRAETSLNPAEAVYAGFAGRELAAGDAAIAALPLTSVAARKPLPLDEGINPAWVDAIRAFDERVVVPLLGEKDALTPADWQRIVRTFAPYREWLAAKPDTGVQALDADHLRRIASDDTRQRLAGLIDLDRTAETSAATILAAERLTRYARNLATLLRNFVALSDFYRKERKAVFQAGTLYIDQRSCELVLRVADMDRHAALAPFSGCYLIYCTCVRKGEEPITIVAALTGGDVDELMVPGRHGVFVDRQGRDWLATVVKVVEQPVSIRQAFWSPYRRFAKLVEDQLRKFAAEREQKVEAAAAGTVGEAAADPEAAKSKASQAFDIAKFAGIFAAIGLAIGAIGTALSVAMREFLELAWWQVPLAIAGILLVISGPSMLLAWLTLRRRNLGPLLDANGWAVNARARINVPFGESLTGIAKLPPGSVRPVVDPFAEPKRGWKAWLVAILLAAALFALWRAGVFRS